MHNLVDIGVWQGRLDAEPGGERWHQKVVQLTPLMIDGAAPGLALLGICSDAGVTRNQGRAGAHKGPDAIRKALANLAWHLPFPCYDEGNLYCTDEDLELLQEEQATWVARLLELGHFPLLLGGGHEMALGSNLGLRRHLQRGAGGIVGIINFDAHFDLRHSERSTSGTPFLQIANHCERERLPFRYFCLGISQSANTESLFRRADSLGAKWLLDEQLTPWRLAQAETELRDFVASCDFIHLSLDLDVLPAAVAAGVSAPSPRGVSLEILEHLLLVLKDAAGAKLKLAEIAECNPDYDADGHTAKVAARLCHTLARKEE
jgi:formiminoglutamase